MLFLFEMNKVFTTGNLPKITNEGEISVANFEHTFRLTPPEYYSHQFPGISTNRKSVKVKCPFHNDHRPSLSINLEEGWYKCFSCGAKGGGIVRFHMSRYSLTYKQTIKELEVNRWKTKRAIQPLKN